jgi:4-hydroxy-4-methyl-2-oxoglutarate aldolase
MVGVALTCNAGPSDNLALFGALSVAKPGDILVAATGGYAGAAVTGDLLLGMARNRGIVGFVTDGMVRDIVGILGVGLPVYCVGVTPNSPARNGPGTVGEPIDLGGVRIESGDILIGDRDGVVVVPRGKAAAVLKTLADVRTAEAAFEEKVKGGLEIPDFILAILASNRVHNIE